MTPYRTHEEAAGAAIAWRVAADVGGGRSNRPEGPWRRPGVPSCAEISGQT